MTKEEILKGIIYKYGDGEDYCNIIFAMQEYADQETSALRQESEDRIIKIRADHFKEMISATQKIEELEKEIDELKFNPETQRLALLCQNRNEQIQSLSARVSEFEGLITELKDTAVSLQRYEIAKRLKELLTKTKQ